MCGGGGGRNTGGKGMERASLFGPHGRLVVRKAYAASREGNCSPVHQYSQPIATPAGECVDGGHSEPGKSLPSVRAIRAGVRGGTAAGTSDMFLR